MPRERILLTTPRVQGAYYAPIRLHKKYKIRDTELTGEVILLEEEVNSDTKVNSRWQ